MGTAWFLQGCEYFDIAPISIWDYCRINDYAGVLPLFPRKQTSVDASAMSALCQKQTHALQQTTALFDHLVGSREQRRRHIKAQHFRRFRINDQLEFVGLLDRKIAGLFTFEDAIDIGG